VTSLGEIPHRAWAPCPVTARRFHRTQQGQTRSSHRSEAEEAVMTETGRPYGGVNERPDDTDSPPGERPVHESVGADPAQEPRAAETPMSEDVTRVPDRAPDHPDVKRPGIADATGPTG
jgi:hypothetical protein